MKVSRKIFTAILLLSIISESAGMAYSSEENVTNMDDIPQVLAQEMNDRGTSIAINYSGPDAQKISVASLKTLLASAYRNTDDDYLRWNWAKLKYTVNRPASDKLQIKIAVSYYTTKAQEDQVDAKADEVIASIITERMSDYEKVKVINQWVIDNVAYDYTMTKRSAYNGFFDHSAVCQGYVLMIDKLCEKAGIPTRIESGSLYGNAHGWNIVNIDGTWYQLDATNNDINNNFFFLVSDRILKDYGYEWAQLDYPACDKVYNVQAEAVQSAKR